MTKFITITSGKGGVGKTTTAINLATALTALGKDAIVLDANLTTPNVNIHLGAPRLPRTLHDALKGEIKVTDAIYKHKAGLKVIPASIALEDLRALDIEKLRHVLKDLEGVADVVFLDSGAGLDKEGIISLEVADEILVITNPDLPSVTGALKTIKVSRDIDKTVLGVVVTKVTGDDLEMKADEIETVLDHPIVGKITYDDNVRKSLRMKYPVVYTHPKSSASKDYMLLATKILGESFDYEIEPNWFYRFLRKFGLKVKRGRKRK